jgi:hypothetical protein
LENEGALLDQETFKSHISELIASAEPETFFATHKAKPLSFGSIETTGIVSNKRDRSESSTAAIVVEHSEPSGPNGVDDQEPPAPKRAKLDDVTAGVALTGVDVHANRDLQDGRAVSASACSADVKE